MKFSAFGKFGRLHDHLRMVTHNGRKRHNTALAIIAELGSESNAHGLAKIATSQKTKRKVMWALLVIVGFTAATLQLSLLVKKYLQFNVVEVSQMRDGMPVEFPSVTICNTHAMALSKVKKRMNDSIASAKYFQWFNFLRKVSFGSQLQARVESIQGFYENMMDEVPLISHDINETLVHCQFNQKKCGAVNFTKHFDGKNFYNCYTFNSNPNESNKVIVHSTGPQNGLSMIISLDNDDPPLNSFGLYNIHDNIAHSAGIRVQVHAPNTMPSPVDHGFDVPPGFSSSIGLKAVMHSRRGYPYGNCTNSRLRDREKYRNTIFSCLQLCKQYIVIRECKCKSSGLPNVVNMPNITYCGTIEDWQGIAKDLENSTGVHNLFLKSLKCEEDKLHNLTNDRSYEVNCKCYQPCEETSYEKSLSISYWPLEFYQYNALDVFYGKRIKDTFMHTAYKYLNQSIEKYDHLSRNATTENRQKLVSSSLPLEEKQEILQATNLIHQNLLRLNIYLEDLSVVEFMQMPAYELADLFADIGGTLGLWMGISVLTIMELMELIIRLIMLLFNSENKAPDHMDQVTNGMLDHTENYPDLYQKSEFETFERNNYRRTVQNPNDLPV